MLVTTHPPFLIVFHTKDVTSRTQRVRTPCISVLVVLFAEIFGTTPAAAAPIIRIAYITRPAVLGRTAGTATVFATHVIIVF